jgi:hypothetical protein
MHRLRKLIGDPQAIKDGADIAKPRRRCCVEPPDLAITHSDPTNRLSDLHNRLGHARHLFGKPIPLGENAFVLRLHMAICFEHP